MPGRLDVGYAARQFNRRHTRIRILLEVVKFIHFLGFVLGLGCGFANIIAARKFAALPKDAAPIGGSLRMALGQCAGIGLVLLWVSGGLLVAMGPGAALFADPVFQAKLLAVLVLTVFSAMANLAIIRAKRTGTPPNTMRMARLGNGAQVTGFLALALAIVAFS